MPEITDEVAAKTKVSVRAAVDEDKHLLEMLQATIVGDLKCLNFLEVTLGADGAGIEVCQILSKKLAAEGRPLSLDSPLKRTALKDFLCA